GKWKTFHKHAGLMQYVPSGMFFARVKVNGTVKRASLETDVFTTAKDLLSAKIIELREPTAALGTFADARLRYMEDINANHALAPKTKRYWNQRMDTLLKSWSGLDKLNLDDINEPMCRKWGTKFAEEFEPITFNNTLTLLRNVLKFAGIKHDKNPTMNLKRLGVKLKQLTLPEPEHFEAIVKTVREAGARQSKDCADLIRFLAFSGCRISEAQQVLWQDVDFERGEIRVHNAKRSKTTSANNLRFVPIIPAMRELLERMQRDNEPKPSDRVCVLGECEKSLTNACRKNSVPRITHHDLRHLFATRCIEAGVDIPTVSRWLGHVDGGALAMKVYGHLRRSHSQESAKLVTFGTPAIVPEIVEPKQLPEVTSTNA
ncbi:MAG: site-specific integrase, partial [Anaerolineaceae bacterium]|nr:site-specific integrase [Anaerolineaceae bacterium]